MKLAEIIERRSAVETEMRTLYDAAETAGEDLTGEKLEKWNALKAERDDLAGKEARARARDELDRQAEGRQITESRGSGEDGATAWLLTPEQRMSQFVARTSGAPEQRLSFGRLARAMLTGDFREAEAEQRVMGGTTGAVGGFLLPSPLSASVIDLARTQSVMISAGVGTIPMTAGTLRIARVVSDPTAYWRDEGDTITESDGTFAAISLKAHSLAALVRVNNELLDDATGFASLIDTMLGSALGLEMDRIGLYGPGGAEPLGLRNDPGLQEVSMGANGLAQPDYDDVLDLIQKVEEANGSVTTLIQSPRTKTKLAELVTGIASDKTKLVPPADYTALRRLTSTQIKINETQGSSNAASTTFVGGFENAAFAVRQSITIEMSRQSSDVFTKNQTHIRAIMRGDFVAYRPALMGRLVGIL